MGNNYPLIIVFYLDRELMMQREIIEPFSQSVNDALVKKDANAIAFFLPTDGEERVECINPLVTPEVEMEKINKMVEDIKTNFSIGVDMDIDGVIEEKSED
jgi:hypothetical protein